MAISLFASNNQLGGLLGAAADQMAQVPLSAPQRAPQAPLPGGRYADPRGTSDQAMPGTFAPLPSGVQSMNPATGQQQGGFQAVPAGIQFPNAATGQPQTGFQGLPSGLQSTVDGSQPAASFPSGSPFGWGPGVDQAHNPMGSTPGPQAGPGGSAPGGSTWAGVNQWNSAIMAAAAKYGLDPNQIRAVMQEESGGDPNAAGASGVWGPMQVNANAWGNGPWMSDPAANIDKGAQILKSYLDQNGGNFREALRGYHGYGSDGNTTDQQYADTVLGYYSQLQSGNLGQQGLRTVGNPAQAGVNNPAGLNVLNVALSYVGKAPYVWGGIPGKGQDPNATGWDCSGLTYWLDQNYGTGQLAMGSHYQFQQAQQTGKLFTDTGQLQPGDLVFIDTGWMGGAGSDLNRAGHVAVYLGNGKILHAANPDSGTIVSDLSSYTSGQFGTFLGGEHMSWSGGSFTGQPSMGGFHLGQIALKNYT